MKIVRTTTLSLVSATVAALALAASPAMAKGPCRDAQGHFASCGATRTAPAKVTPKMTAAAPAAIASKRTPATAKLAAATTAAKPAKAKAPSAATSAKPAAAHAKG